MGEQPAGVRFRYHAAITVAALIVLVSGLSLAGWASYLLPLLVIPAAAAWWGWRVGTDADPEGLTVRAAVASRRVPWSAIEAIVVDRRGHVVARLAGGSVLALPAVTATDAPRLVAASGRDVVAPARPPT